RQRGRAGLQRLAIERVRPPERPSLEERVANGGRQHPVAVDAGAGVAARVEAVGRALGLDDRDLAGQERVQGAPELLRGFAIELEACDLPPGVDPGVRPARDREPDRPSEYALQGGLDLALDGPQPRLRGPAGERPAVVGDRQAVGRHRSAPRLAEASPPAGMPRAGSRGPAPPQPMAELKRIAGSARPPAAVPARPSHGSPPRPAASRRPWAGRLTWSGVCQAPAP